MRIPIKLVTYLLIITAGVGYLYSLNWQTDNYSIIQSEYNKSLAIEKLTQSSEKGWYIEAFPIYSDSDQFLTDNSIVGYLTDTPYFRGYKKIPLTENVTLTGRIIRNDPGIPAIILAKAKTNYSAEVKIQDNGYLIAFRHLHPDERAVMNKIID